MSFTKAIIVIIQNNILTKFLYDIQDQPIEELQNIFLYITSKENELVFKSIKLKYADYLSGNYYKVINDYSGLSIDPKIEITEDSLLVISILASSIHK
jgi:hypothetical protein